MRLYGKRGVLVDGLRGGLPVSSIVKYVDRPQHKFWAEQENVKDVPLTWLTTWELSALMPCSRLALPTTFAGYQYHVR